MSKVQMLRCLVNQRLTAAAEEIFGVFERTIAEYEEELCRSKEENERQRKLLDGDFNPQLRLHRADVQQLLVVKEEVPSEQQDWSSSLDQEDPEPPHIKEDQEDPEPPHIKEDQEELWTSQEGEQLQGLEEADIKFSFTPVKIVDDEEKPQSSQLHQRQTEQIETEADGEDCGGPEPDRNPDPLNKTGDAFEPETDDSEDWEETREPQSGLIYQSNDEVSVSDSRCSAGEKPFGCSECDKRFNFKRGLKRHMRTHIGAKPFSCTVCKNSFTRRGSLQRHMRSHTGEKPFSCSVCKKSFTTRGHFQSHMKSHTREKPFSCSVCKKSFYTETKFTETHENPHLRETIQLLSMLSKTLK
ncbi:zinc finger protein 184-like [Cebidichthys violaceus]|uniref:zinc finger protein 184-like n=1 Tax=Cebidichthys violaceus TaxID=271503 RepID=UPI0035CBFA10